MKKAVAAIAFALILLVVLSAGAMAYDVTKNDYIQPPSTTVSIEGQTIHPNLQNGVLFVNKICYGGEKVNIVYIVQPSSTSEATVIAGRTYTITTQLSNNHIDAYAFRYSSDYSLTSAYPIESGSTSVTLNLPGSNEWQYGYGEINITVSGVIPTSNSRLTRLVALKVEVQGAPPDCLPPVIIPVVNKSKFQSDINCAENKYNELKANLDKYIGKVDTSSLSKDLTCAHDNLTDAKTLFNSEDYLKADEKLNFTDNWLNRAEKDLKKVKAEYMCKQLQDRASDISELINEISAYIDEINSGSIKLPISEKTQYIAQFKMIQNKYESIESDISAVQSAINQGLYNDAIARVNNSLSSANKLYISAENLLNQLESKINATPTKTSKKSNTTAFPSINISGTTLYIIGGIVVAVIVIVALLFLRGGGKFDELR